MDNSLPLSRLVSQAAHRYPTRPALSSAEKLFTWYELDQAVAHLASHLVSSGIRRAERVAIWMPKTAEAIMAIMALTRIGAVPAPLEPTDPSDRILRMLKNASIHCILTTARCEQNAVAALSRLHPSTVLNPLRESGDFVLLRGETTVSPPTDDGGYLLFTSGSTGWPKGVLLTQQNVFFFAQWAANQINLTEEDRIGSQASLTFDLSTFDIFSATVAGACICVMPNEIRPFSRDVSDWLMIKQITVLYAVPTLLQNLVAEGSLLQHDASMLRTIIYAGEPFRPDSLRILLRALPQTTVYNFYGPTETNVCTFEKVTLDTIGDTDVSIGNPVPGILINIFDEGFRPADEGQLWVAGPTVMIGYLQDGRLHDPTRMLTFAGRQAPQRAYPTGDLAWCGSDGRFYLKGRQDHQIKRNGYRIDLLDIESTLQTIPAITQCAAVARRVGDETDIIAFIVTPPEHANDIILQARKVLPMRMIPNRFVVTDNLPLTTNGKIDRNALKTKPLH